VPEGARVIDAQGQYLIPGLIDSHVHLLFLINGSAGEELALDLRDLLAQGVTTLRDMGNDPGALLPRVRALSAAPRVYAMQLVAGRRFFFNGFRGTKTTRGVVYRQPPALTMQRLGWRPLLFHTDDNADQVVAEAREAGAMGLKLYAQLDSLAVRRLTEAAHRAGMPVWGHAWLQPTSVLEESTAGMDGVVLAAAALAEIAIAGLGVVGGLSRAASAISAEPARQGELLLRWVREGAGLMSLGLVLALAVGLALLALRRRAGTLAEEWRSWQESEPRPRLRLVEDGEPVTGRRTG